jgi:hypothetical protein
VPDNSDAKVTPDMPTTWKPIVVFFALTILLLAIVPTLSALTGATMDFGAAAASATEKTGGGQTSNLLIVLRLALAEPALWLLILGSSVPSVAALFVCGWTRRPALPAFRSSSPLPPRIRALVGDILNGQRRPIQNFFEGLLLLSTNLCYNNSNGF